MKAVKERKLFGIEDYSADYLLQCLENIKAGRCESRNGWLYFTMVVRGLRGMVEGKQEAVEEFDERLKELGFGDITIIGRGVYVDLLLDKFGR